MSGYTKGPWDGTHGVMRPNEGKPYFPIFAHCKGGGDPTLCTVWASVPDEEFEANAALIAAAPDLLEVVCRLLREDAAGHYTIGLIEDAQAAVAKARGGEA